MPKFWVNGVVAARDGKPYIQLSNENGMIAQLTMVDARAVAMDILVMCSRSEADAMLLKFFRKNDFPENAAGAMLVDFRDFRHDLDMETSKRFEGDPEDGQI